jgi:hypothetical protein
MLAAVLFACQRVMLVLMVVSPLKNVADRINGSTVEFLKDGIVVSIRTISDAGNIIEIAPDAHIIFDQVKLTFCAIVTSNVSVDTPSVIF